MALILRNGGSQSPDRWLREPRNNQNSGTASPEWRFKIARNTQYHTDPRMDPHFHALMNTYNYEDALFRINYKLKEFRDLKELCLQFNARNGGNPSQAQIELEELIETYWKSRHKIFREFASLLEKYKSSIINSFIMVEKIGNGRIYDSRLSNGPIESINRKIKDLKQLGRCIFR